MSRMVQALSQRVFVRLPLFLVRLKRALSHSRPIPPGPPSFLVVRLDAMGDLILTTPLFRDLKQSFPGSTITVVTHRGLRSVLEDNPFIDTLYTLPPVKPGGPLVHVRLLWAALQLVFQQLSRRRYTYAISPRWDADMHPANLLCLLAPSHRTVGFPDRARVRFDWPFRIFGDLFDITAPGEGLLHEVLRNRSIVTALSGSCGNRPPEVFPSAEHRAKAANLLSGAPPGALVLGIGIGAQASFRRWPLENYAQVVQLLASHGDVYPVILCAPSEKHLAESLARQLHVPSCVAADPDLRVTASVLEQCDAFVGNDSGPAHLAAATGCAVVVVSPHPIGGDANHPNSPARFAPFCKRSIVLQPEAAVPCQACCSAEDPHCILGVTPAQVVNELLTFLNPPAAKIHAAGESPVL